MNNKKKLLSLLLPTLLVAPALVSAKVINNKQLAGPPVEFEFMQQARPELSAIKSKTALIPVNLQQTKKGSWVWNANLPVDSKDFSFLVFANGAKDWKINLVNPITRETLNINDVASKQMSTQYGIDSHSYPAEKFEINNSVTGDWGINISTDGEPEQFEGFIMLSSKSKYLLNSYKTNADQIVGHNIHFVTQSTSNEDIIEVLKDFNPINSASMRVTNPNGEITNYPMFDDGLHGDNLANDGIFGGDYKADMAGGYSVQIAANGQNPNGTPFLRTTEHFVPVIEQTIGLSAQKATAFSISDNRLNIALNVENHTKKLRKGGNRYRIIAEVWGAGQKGEMKPVSWISTITDIQKGQLNIELDARWIAMANVENSFELRNLRIEDADNFIPLITQENMELKIASLPKSASKSFDGMINKEMLMGKMPTNLANKTLTKTLVKNERMFDGDFKNEGAIQLSNEKAAGGKLLLVHGYCSSDVWGPFQGQFSNSAKFTDFDQNRTHDQFANLIKNYGAQFPSFGVVAHSQGGAASLHLYTYYWSGLDNSTGSRMIQSVGTPYQGTPLAGNLAALGNVFGAGCGYNANLTTSGAASWLAGIPTWARNQVNYYTTSFATKWWRNDYCSFATDLFLSDPEDGVIEKSRGQLSGGNNRGHKTGWCHTLDMRDAGQTSDSSRNSTMSYYAKR